VKNISALFGMDDRTWARHANPWSVWTRVAILPLLALAIWSRVWIGWWVLVPVIGLAVWTWINPRAFPPPLSTNSWASKAVLGERVWLNRRSVPIPEHHRRAANILTMISASGLLPLAWGLTAVAFWPTIFGVVLTALGKLWFVDRMVWLYEDMKDVRPEYRAWLY
jgi:hypothetical protein